MLELSVVVVCFNEEQHIGPCIDSLLKQTYPSDQFEILIVDGNSKDRTLEIVRGYTALHPQVQLVIEPRPGTAIARNTGVQAARFAHIAFIDADCEAPPEWLERLTAHFATIHAHDPAVIAVGGSNIPPPDGPPFVLAVGLALDSFAGSFNSAQGRQFTATRQVISLPTLNVLYAKEAIEAIGGFDATLGSEAEDAELNYRLYAQGKRFVFIPDLPVLHKFRPTPAIWYKNMLRYGRGRARLLKRHPEMWAPIYLLPPLFLLGMASLLLFWLHPIFWLAGLYFPALLAQATWLAWRKRRLDLTGQIALVFIVQHFGYAIGETWGLLNPHVR